PPQRAPHQKQPRGVSPGLSSRAPARPWSSRPAYRDRHEFFHFPAEIRPATPHDHRHPQFPQNPRNPNNRNHLPPIRKPKTRTPKPVSAPSPATTNQNPRSGPGHRLRPVSPVRTGSVAINHVKLTP